MPEKRFLQVLRLYPDKLSKHTIWYKLQWMLAPIVSLSYHAQIIRHLCHAMFAESSFNLAWSLQVFDSLLLLSFRNKIEVVSEIEDALSNPLLTTYPKEFYFVKKKLKIINFFCNLTASLIFTEEILYFVVYTKSGSLPIDAEPPCNINNGICYFGFYVYNGIFACVVGMAYALLECIFYKWAITCICLLEILYLNLKNADYEHNKTAYEDLKINVRRHIEILK